MFLRKRIDDRRNMMSMGMLCLLLANIVHWFLRPTVFLGQGLIDGTFGLLMGVSIGCNLLSLRTRQCRRDEA
jgi:hypothetical protein